MERNAFLERFGRWVNRFCSPFPSLYLEECGICVTYLWARIFYFKPAIVRMSYMHEFPTMWTHNAFSFSLCNDLLKVQCVFDGILSLPCLQIS